MKDTRVADFGAGLAFAVLGAIVIYLAADLQSMPRGIGPGGYPRVVGAMMIALGLVQVGRVLSAGLPSLSLSVNPRPVALVAATLVGAFVYVYAVRYIGFVILTPVLLYFLLMLYGYKKYLRAAVISIGVSTVVYVVFAKIFMIFLPQFTLF